MNKDGETFKNLKSKFQRLGNAKIKDRIFVSPQIRSIKKDTAFYQILEWKEKIAWEDFKIVVRRFLGSRKDQNYQQLVKELLQMVHDLECNISKDSFFTFSSWFFPKESEGISDEHGGWFHQPIITIERRYQGR